MADNNSGEVWWIKLFIQVGFPTALAIVLIAALLGWMPSPIMQSISRLEYNAWQQTIIARATCYNLEALVVAQQATQNRVIQKASCDPWKPQP